MNPLAKLVVCCAAVTFAPLVGAQPIPVCISVLPDNDNSKYYCGRQTDTYLQDPAFGQHQVRIRNNGAVPIWVGAWSAHNNPQSGGMVVTTIVDATIATGYDATGHSNESGESTHAYYKWCPTTMSKPTYTGGCQ